MCPKPEGDPWNELTPTSPPPGSSNRSRTGPSLGVNAIDASRWSAPGETVNRRVTNARRVPKPSTQVGAPGAVASRARLPRWSKTVRFSTRSCAETVCVAAPTLVTVSRSVRAVPGSAVTASWVGSTSRLLPRAAGVP